MTVLAEAMAAQEFGKDAEGNIRWPGGPEVPVPAAEPAAPAAAAAPKAAPAAAPVKATKLSGEPVPEPPVTGQAAPLDRERPKKTLLGG